jgi:NADPH:quinone reductase-like Zn-dependent oxidoreductase
MDLMQREGKYNVRSQAGKTLGVEFSGWVQELGRGDTDDFKVGDEVFGLAYGGQSSIHTKYLNLTNLKKGHMLSTLHRRQRC